MSAEVKRYDLGIEGEGNDYWDASPCMEEDSHGDWVRYEDYVKLKEDAELGRIAIRFVDRAGDTCDVDTAETICAEFHRAMADEVERLIKERSK